MNHYGISAIHWNADLGEVDEVLLHKLVWHEHKRMFAFEPGEPTTCSDVVRHSWRRNGLGKLRTPVGAATRTRITSVSTSRDRQAYLTVAIHGRTPTPALTDLPRYPADDPPLDSVAE
jgi:hypothetical protein